MTEHRFHKHAKVTFLGTGTSQGIPMIGCDCPACTSADPFDKRLRSSVLVEYGGLSILVDAGPDFRTQMLRANVRHIDAILLTHGHKDHTGGLDDTRGFNLLEGHPSLIYAEGRVLDTLRREYAYAFAEPRYPGAPEWRVHEIHADKPFLLHSNALEDRISWIRGKGYQCEPSPLSEAEKDLSGVEIVPIQGWHDRQKKLSVLGYRFGPFAYVTDFAYIEPAEIEKLRGVRAITAGCVKREAHIAHFSLQEALDFFAAVGAEHSYLTHLSHLLGPWQPLQAELPAGVHIAYDGLTLEL